jgi:hypothetical protein
MSMEQQNQPSSGSGVPRWAWWIGALVLLNVLSQVFGWGFIFY